MKHLLHSLRAGNGFRDPNDLTSITPPDPRDVNTKFPPSLRPESFTHHLNRFGVTPEMDPTSHAYLAQVAGEMSEAYDRVTDVVTATYECTAWDRNRQILEIEPVLSKECDKALVKLGNIDKTVIRLHGEAEAEINLGLQVPAHLAHQASELRSHFKAMDETKRASELLKLARAGDPVITCILDGAGPLLSGINEKLAGVLRKAYAEKVMPSAYKRSEAMNFLGELVSGQMTKMVDSFTQVGRYNKRELLQARDQIDRVKKAKELLK